MSNHVIHGMTIKVGVVQGNLTDTARGHCIGKVVNLCRDMPAANFVESMHAMADGHGNAKSAAMLAALDDALAANYTKRYIDEFAPIASLKIVEG